MNWKSTGIQYALLLFSFISIFTFSIQSCKKSETADVETLLNEKGKIDLNNFFSNSTNVSPVVESIILFLKKQASTVSLAGKVQKVGTPLWRSPLILNAPNQAFLPSSNNGDTSNLKLNHVFVPIVIPGTTEVEGALACMVDGDSITVRFLNEKEYKRYGFDSAKPDNAANLTNLMMYLQHKLFGTNRFLINDARLIDEKYPASKVVVQFSETGLKKDDGSQQALSDYVEVEICTTIELVTCPHHPGQLCGDYNNNGLYTVTRCQSYWIWAYGGGTGGGGSSEDPEGGGGGGGSSGGSASVSLLYHLEQTLGLSYEEKNTIAPYGTLCEEIYNHLNYNNSLETADERKAMALSHVKYLYESGYYLNFATTFSSHNESLENFPLPWFHFNNLDQTNPALYENIYHLKLRAKQAYYLLNNPVRSEEIYNNSQVSVLPIDIRYSRIKFHIDKLMTNPSYVAFISNYAATNNGNIMWWESPIFNTGNNVDWNFWIDTNAEIPSNANGSENYEYIQNIEDYLKCFNDGKTASSYELKIYIDDPAGDGAFQPDYIKKGY